MNTFPSFNDIHRTTSQSFGSSGLQSNREESQNPFKVYIQTKPKVQVDDEALKDNSPGIELRFKENIIETRDLRTDLSEMFHFDHMLSQNSSLKETFAKIAIPLIKNTLMGHNNSIFVYDHCRFGKNQTAGFYGNTLNKDSESLVANCLKYFFQYFEMVSKSQGDNYRWRVRISLAQIYVNNVIDLLDPNKSLLNIPEREDSIQSAKIKVENIEQAFSLLNDGLFIKSDLHQSLNRISEKSHHILTLEVTQEFQTDKIIKSVSEFSIVDLAYLQERGETLTDSEILENKVLKSTLQGLRKQFHVSPESSPPHQNQRNSTLLKYLHNYFGGENKRISLIATISSSSADNRQETLSTLKFACKKHNGREFKVIEKSSNTQRSQSGVEETMNTLRATNTTEADFPVEKKRMFDKSGESGELLKCLFNTMIDIKKLFLDKILDTFYIREKFVAKMIEELQKNLEDNKSNVEKLDAKFYLKQNKLLKEIQKKFPNSPIELPKGENDIDSNILISDNIENVVHEMKKAATFIIESIICFGKNSINLEKVKFELLKEKSEKLKMDADIQNLSVLVQTLCKQNKKFYGEIVMSNYSDMKLSDRNRLYAAYQQEQNTLIKSLNLSDLERKFELSDFESEILTKEALGKGKSLTKAFKTIGVQTDSESESYFLMNPNNRVTSFAIEGLKDIEPKTFSLRKSSGQELTFRRRTMSRPNKENWMDAQLAFMNEREMLNIQFDDEQTSEALHRGLNDDFDDESSSFIDDGKKKFIEGRKKSFAPRDDEDEMRERNSEDEERSVDFSGKVSKPMVERNTSVPSNALDFSSPDLKFEVDGLSQYSEIPEKAFAAEESKIEPSVGGRESLKEAKADAELIKDENLLDSKRDNVKVLEEDHTEEGKETKRTTHRKNTIDTETHAKSTEQQPSPILNNLLSLTETKSHLNIRDMVDVSNFTLESPSHSQVSTKDLLALKKLNGLKFKDPATVLKPKNKMRGRIPTQSFSLAKLSLGNLSLSLEKVDIDKYSVDAKSRFNQSPEHDPNDEMDVYGKNIYSSLTANKRLTTDQYRLKSKLIKLDDKPSLPKLLKVSESLTPKKKRVPGLRSFKTTNFGSKKDKSNSSIEVDKSFDRLSTFE